MQVLRILAALLLAVSLLAAAYAHPSVSVQHEFEHEHEYGHQFKLKHERYVEVNGQVVKVEVEAEVSIEGNVVHYEYEIEGNRHSVELELRVPGQIMAERNGLKLQLRIGQLLREYNLIPPDEVLQYIKQHIPKLNDVNIARLKLEKEYMSVPGKGYVEVPVYKYERRMRGLLLGLIPLEFTEEIVCPATPDVYYGCIPRKPLWAALIWLQTPVT